MPAGSSTKGGGNIRALYYISPQIWAWKAGRRFEMARHLDAMAVIFPFEVKSYADTPMPVEFVGHPFVAGDYRSPVRYDAAGPVLLLPGSRRQAVARIFPALLAGYAGLPNAIPTATAVVLHPSEEIGRLLEPLWRRRKWAPLAGRVTLQPHRRAGRAPLRCSPAPARCRCIARWRESRGRSPTGPIR